MEGKKNNFLPQLENSIPEGVTGYSLSQYSVALEGWRRGLTLKFINNNRRKSELDYSLTYNGNERYFTVTRGDAVPRSAIHACINKNKTKDYLVKAEVPTPDGETFDEQNNDEEIVNYSKQLGYPVVLKPSDGTGGVGVIANIKDENEFREALSYVKYDLNYLKLIVEKFAPGDDYRVKVVDEQVVAALKKLPANIVGDGKNNIEYLIKQKNKQRKLIPALSDKPIKVDKETHNLLRSIGYNLESIPKKDERVFLKTKNNISSGGDSIDVTDEITDEIKEIAINASKAIPGLVQCGIDMMVDETKQTGYILEVNSRPHINSQLFPMEGKARDIPKAVIDYYFPETKQPDYSQGPLYYFNFNSMYESFKHGHCKEFTIPDIPKGDLTSTRFIITGVINGVKYENWVRKQALKLKLHGYIKSLKAGESSVVVSGSTESINKFRDIIKNTAPKKAEVINVIEKNRERPVQVGFEIKLSTSSKDMTVKKSTTKATKDGYYPVYVDIPPVKEMKSSNKSKMSKNKNKGNKKTAKIPAKDYNLQQERDYYKKKYDDILNSRAWKATKPVRIIGSSIKRLLNLK